jgi:hypothetical protein
MILATDVSVLSLWPDLPPGIKSMELTAKEPDGTVKVLLLLQDVLTEWPTPYILKQPVMLPRNSEISLTAYCKDSAAPEAPTSIKLTASVFRPASRTHARL